MQDRLSRPVTLPVRGSPILGAHDRLWHVVVQRLLAPTLARAQLIKAHPCYDGRQPSAQVLDAVGVGAVVSEPGFLDGVVRLAKRSKHSVGHRPQMGLYSDPQAESVLKWWSKHLLQVIR